MFMDQQATLAIFTIAAFVGLTATALIILRRERRSRPTQESPFAASTEGMTTCYRCSRANFPTEAACLYCGSPLPRHRDVG
jgi:hypothetical protein